MFSRPPAWRVRWRSLVNHFIKFVKATFVNMAVLVRLRVMPRKWLIDAIPPYQDPSLYKDPEDCDHSRVRRYGNKFGRFARCEGCGRKYRWQPDLQLWCVDFTNSSGSSPLPAPSSANTISQGERAALNSRRTSALMQQSKSRAAPPASRTSSTARPRSSEEPAWEPAHWGPPQSQANHFEETADFYNLHAEDDQDLESTYLWEGEED